MAALTVRQWFDPGGHSMTDFWVGPASAPDTYHLLSLLGRGGEGEVWKAVLPLSTDGRRLVAVKITRTRADDDGQWEQFGHLLRSLSHPGLVRVTDVFIGPAMHRREQVGDVADDAAMRYVVMDYIDGLNFRDWIAENPDSTASRRLQLLGMVAAALDEMHSGTATGIAVAHGDVKPANIVVRSDGAAILVDLGLVRLADASGVTGRSAAYAAPELRTPGALATPETDRYAFAVTTAHLLTGKPPPLGADGWLNPPALRELLAASPLTARRHLLVHRIMNAISSRPEARPRQLRQWLDGAVESLSQVTNTSIPVVSASPPAPIAPPTQTHDSRLGETYVPNSKPPRPKAAAVSETGVSPDTGTGSNERAVETEHPPPVGAIGEQFGPYRLDSLLGRGGMGEVFRALDTRRNRVVAVKRLPASLAGDPEFQARFREESELAAKLNEPHIIPIHDYGEIDGRLFIDMRLVEGTDVAHVLADHGPLVPIRAVHIIRQVASALDAAHAAGLVHRDVKPANVLLRTEETDTSTDLEDGHDFAYLVDFGIARVVSSTKPGLTATGGAIGSLTYMAPERFRGESDHRVDIYSLGCLLYELLTGQHPFPADDAPTAIHGHLYLEPPRPSRINPAVPRALDAVIAKAMAKDPNQRYSTASALAIAARAALAEGAAVADAGNANTSYVPFGAYPAAHYQRPLMQQPMAMQRPPAPPWPVPAPVPLTTPAQSGRTRMVWALAASLMLLVLAGLGVGAYQLLSNSAPAEDPALAIAQEPIMTPGVNPFMPSVGKDVPEVKQPAEARGTFKGGIPGLYGGTMNNAECDRPSMIAFLQANPDKAAAWADVEKIAVADLPGFIYQLTPVILRADTEVTNHGFSGGHATSLQSVLQAGTAVLVDEHGVPRSRCYCGNPLGPPERPAGSHYTEPAWPRFDKSNLLTVAPNDDAIPEFTLIDFPTGRTIFRPRGSDGSQDRGVVDPPPSLPPAPTPYVAPTPVPRPVLRQPVRPVPSTPTDCPDGQHHDSGKCVPDKSKPSCPDGKHLNADNECVYYHGPSRKPEPSSPAPSYGPCDWDNPNRDPHHC